uniref:Uncharacterized protein n=1 Tax=Oryza barthii TaxID=65489 RepID=A0A0D3HRQ4_9ORYZ
MGSGVERWGAVWSGERCVGRSGTEVGRESRRRHVDGINPGGGGGEKRERMRERRERNLGGDKESVFCGTKPSLYVAW